MTTTKANWQKEFSGSLNKVYLPSLPKSHGVRVECSQGCGKGVTKEMGICRKCRREMERKTKK